MALAGQSELSRSFFRFCDDIVEPSGWFRHKYNPNGTLASSCHPEVRDGRQVLAVQQDETALVVWALREHFRIYRDVEFLKPLYNSIVIPCANWLLEHRDHHGLPKPSWDLWEERRGIHTFTGPRRLVPSRPQRNLPVTWGPWIMKSDSWPEPDA